MFKSKEHLMLQKAWARAYQGDPVICDYKDPKLAQSMRMKLYNAVKSEKQGKGEHFMIKVAESIELVYGETKSILILRRKSDNPAFKILGQAIGESIDSVVDEAAVESERRVLEMMGMLDKVDKPAPIPLPASSGQLADEYKVEHKENPFYPKRS